MKQNTKYFRFLITISIILLFSASETFKQTELTTSDSFSLPKKEPKLALGNFKVLKHSTYIKMKDVDNIAVEEEFKIQNNQNDTDFLFISLKQNYTDLIIKDQYLEQIYYEKISDTGLQVNLSSILTTGNHTTISLHYKLEITLDPVQAEPVYYIFPFTQYFTYSTDEYMLEVKLPVGCFPHESLNCSPLGYTTQLSINRLFIYWEDQNLNSSTSPYYLIFFYEQEIPSRNIWAYIIGPLIGLIAGAAIVYLWMKKGSTRLEEELEKIYLTKNQQILLKLISEKQGKITQQQLIMITNFTKSKVSRNLTPLEENGLIEKEKWGREYKVSMTKKGQKVVNKIVAEELQNLEKINQTDISKEKKTI